MNTWTTPSGTASNLCRDILKQPHTLIAGTTGSGKSVLMNSIIYNALYESPAQAQFILIDTKLTELNQYKELPHTAAYITTPAAAVAGLEQALKETRRRGEAAAAQGLKEYPGAHLYIFIDELGDLVFSDRAAVPVLAQIAMIGRAARVHLIAGTQCPNRKTLSAELTANCAARVGLRCRDKIESRQIIGSPAAVGLPMHGQGYYLSPAYCTPQLVNIPLTAEKELAARVEWWTKQKPRRRWWSR